MRRLAMLAGAAHAARLAARLGGALPPSPPTPPDPDDLSEEQKLIFSLIAVGLVLLAGLMSGLTLGLLQLDVVDLEVLRRSGTPRERSQAARIEPVVRHPHRLLVTLVLCNAAAMEALPIFLDRLTDPITAVALSTTVVLIFGEVIPQAICSRYGLAVGANCVWLVRALMALAWPIAGPIAAVLDALLGHGASALFRRAQLKALVDAHAEVEGLGGNLTGDEIAVIRGALDLSAKTAADCLTPLDKLFCLPADARLDAATLHRIVASGHSRVPVHAPGDRAAIVGMLLVKELILIDHTRPPRVGDLTIRSLPFLRADTKLYDMLRLFESGRCHMAVLVSPPGAGSSSSSSSSSESDAESDVPLYDPDDAAAWTDGGGSDGGPGGGTPGGGAGGARRPRRARARLAAGEALAEVLKARGDRDAARARVAAGGVVTVGTPRDGLAVEAGADGAPAAASPPARPLPTRVASSSSSTSDGGGHVLGVLTLEDLVEELIGAEIVDETDQWVDNDRTTRVNAAALAARLPTNMRSLLREGVVRVGPPARGDVNRATGLPHAPAAVRWAEDGVRSRPANGGWALPPAAPSAAGSARWGPARPYSAGPPVGRGRAGGGASEPLLPPRE